MSFTLRKYQEEALEASLKFIGSESNKNGLIIAPTGAGKSLIIAAIANAVKDPIVILQPSKELLEQNYNKYLSYGNEASIFSSSMGVKEIGHVTFATIGSIKSAVNDVKDIQPKLFLIDEAHLQSKKSSQLATFLGNFPKAAIIGLTATPLELRGGGDLAMINRSMKNIFNNIIHCTQVKDIVNLGFWSDIVYDNKVVDKDSLTLNSSGSDYTDKSLKLFHESNGLNAKIKKEVKNLLSEGRKSILIFCGDIDNAEIIAKSLKCKAVHSKVGKKDRNDIINKFKSLKLKVVTNVNVLSVGFDHPELDAIICARPTKSFAVYYQQLGRGVRPHPNKKDVKIVDFSGNVETFGELGTIEFLEEKGRWGMFCGDKQITIGKVFDEDPNPVMCFGKYRGELLKKVPISYLKWANANIKDINGDRMIRNMEQIKIFLSSAA